MHQLSSLTPQSNLPMPQFNSPSPRLTHLPLPKKLPTAQLKSPTPNRNLLMPQENSPKRETAV